MMTQKKIEEMSLDEIAEWVRDTCLMFGASTSTAYQVAAVFIRGLESKP